jgi:hypothetical protein
VLASIGLHRLKNRQQAVQALEQPVLALNSDYTKQLSDYTKQLSDYTKQLLMASSPRSLMIAVSLR